MRLVLTVVAPATHAAAAAAALEAFSATVAGARQRRRLAERPWFSEEVVFDGAVDVARAQARGAFAGAPFDHAVVEAAGRRKRLLVADMDSTILATESLDELAAAAGVGDAIAAITARSMAGELDFAASLRERVGLLAGRPAALIDELLKTPPAFNSGALALVRTMRAAGARTALVSGGFTPFVAQAATTAGFDVYAANRLIEVDGQLTGGVVEPILDRAAKRDALAREAAVAGVGVEDALAIGDGANDLDLIRAAGFGVGYRPKPALAEAADACIRICDLTAALFFQGYSADEIVSGD